VSKYNAIKKSETKEETAVYNKQYFQKHKTEINIRRVGYTKKYHDKYPIAKLIASHRSRIYSIMKGSDIDLESSLDIIGCSKEFFLHWIEWQLDEDETMETYGKDTWHLDHCIPCTLFDSSNERDMKRCFHWSNLQPLDALHNLSKNNTTTEMEQFIQHIKIHAFVKKHGSKYENKYNMLNYNRYKYTNA
jgi:hypothetical protein